MYGSRSTFGRIGCRRISWIGLVEFEREGNGREWEESIVVEMVREVTEEESNLRARRGQGSNQGNLRKFGSNSVGNRLCKSLCSVPFLSC